MGRTARDPWEIVRARGWEVSPSGCWELHRADALASDYVMISVGWRGRQMAHRISYEHHNGPIPDGLVIRHRCDNPPCINPGHLLLGTKGDNNRDTRERGRLNPRRGSGHGMARLTEADVREIRRLLGEGSLSTDEIGGRFGVTRGCINNIRRGETWGHLN